MDKQTKPKCKLSGSDGNIFALTGKAARVLKTNGQQEKAKEMAGRIFASGSYYEALSIIEEYVDVS